MNRFCIGFLAAMIINFAITFFMENSPEQVANNLQLWVDEIVGE